MSSLLKENKSPALASGDTAHRFKFIYWFLYFLHVFPVHSLVSAEKPNKLPLQEALWQTAAERDRRPLAPQTSSLPLSLCTKLKENQGETRAAFKVWWTAELHAYWWVRPPCAVRGWQPGGHQLSRIKKFGLAAAYTPAYHLVRTQATRNHPESYRSGSRGRCYVHFDHHLISLMLLSQKSGGLSWSAACSAARRHCAGGRLSSETQRRKNYSNKLPRLK